MLWFEMSAKKKLLAEITKGFSFEPRSPVGATVVHVSRPKAPYYDAFLNF